MSSLLPSSERHDLIVDTACPLDCPDSCSLTATINDGRIVKIDGSTRNPVTAGYICAKVRRFAGRIYGADRLMQPGVRQGPKGAGQFRTVSWDESLDRIATAMRTARDRWGGESILPFFYGGSNGLLSQDTTDARLFRRFGASRLTRTVCASTTGAVNQALYGKMPSITYEDYVHARLIVIWGANPSVTGIHLVPYVREAQRRGARLVVVDPRVTQLARLADLHLPVKPGTDVAVALAVHRHLFEQHVADLAFLEAHTHGADRLEQRARPWTFERASATSGVAEEHLRRFADWYAASSPAVIRCGWGVERNRNGGNSVAAILALPAVAGKFGVRGGGYTMSNSASWPVTKTWIDEPEADTRLVNMNHLGRALTEYDNPPVKLLFVYNCNPAVTMPNQNLVLRGLEREDLVTVVFDQVLTDTAMYADVVLPATTFLEGYDFARAYGPLSLQLGRSVIDSIGAARPNVDVFADLGERLGLSREGEPSDELEMMLRILSDLPEGIGASLRDDGRAVPPCGFAPVQFVDVFPRTADGKIDLFPEALEREAPGGLYTCQPDPASARYPLALISPATGRTISSTLGELPGGNPHLVVHPDDAAPRGIADGDDVRVFNELGEVRCRATVSKMVRPGTLSLPKGLWRRSTANGQTANALAPDTLSDVGAGACFNDARVEVEGIKEETDHG